MNKIAIIIAGVILICAGCAPIGQPPVVTQAPATIIVPPPPPKKIYETTQPPAPVVLPVVYPKNAIVRQKPLQSIGVYPGSLRENIERISAHYGWHQVIWDVPQDFRWVGYAQIQGDTLASVLHQLLNDYPLQAVFYQGNHVLYIHPRTLK
ncbi:MAG: TcpQ domain-containing protein [Proteobacteria bacterium]|nr:TcpQ domain-containing protein [Pseudomonadota bacterium]